MNLPKQIYLYQVQLIVHFLLLLAHLLGVSEFDACVESMEVAKVKGEGLLEVDEGNLLVTLYELGLKAGGGGWWGLGGGCCASFWIYINITHTPTPLHPFHFPQPIPPKPLIRQQLLLNGQQILIKRHLHNILTPIIPLPTTTILIIQFLIPQIVRKLI